MLPIMSLTSWRFSLLCVKLHQKAIPVCPTGPCIDWLVILPTMMFNRLTSKTGMSQMALLVCGGGTSLSKLCILWVSTSFFYLFTSCLLQFLHVYFMSYILTLVFTCFRCENWTPALIETYTVHPRIFFLKETQAKRNQTVNTSKLFSLLCHLSFLVYHILLVHPTNK